MHIEVLYALISVIIISLIALVAAIPFLFKRKVSQQVLVMLLSLSVGTLLGASFLHFLPEAFENSDHTATGLLVLLGFIFFFILEKIIHWHHGSGCKDNERIAHAHAYHIAAINLIGDAIHNFLDGMVVAGSYIASVPLGIAATISVIFHEIPQEIADFGVLLYSGMSKKKALLFNLLSAFGAILGAVFAILLSSNISDFSNFIIPFAAGNFIYIASANLVPELHRHCRVKDTIKHVLMIIAGICIMLVLSLFGAH